MSSNSYKVWQDKNNNRLHMVLSAEFCQADVDSIANQALSIAKKLKPGFSVNIISELDGWEPSMCSGNLWFDPLPLASRKQPINRILDAIGPHLIA